MLLRNQFDGWQQHGWIVDVSEVRTDCAGERALLTACVLVSLIKERFHFRVGLEHAFVKPSRDSLRIAGNQWCNFLDDPNRFFA